MTWAAWCATASLHRNGSNGHRRCRRLAAEPDDLGMRADVQQRRHGCALSTRSILDQDGVDFEIVVVDDASSDGCAAIAATMLRPGDRLIRNESARSQRKPQQVHRTRAGHPHSIRARADDWLLPGALQRLAACFDNPAVGLAFAPRRVVQEDIPWWWRTVSKPHRFFPTLSEHNEEGH